MADFEQPEDTEAAPADDIRSQLTAALATQEAPAESATEPQAQDPVAKPEGDRARAPDGKFIAKDKDAEPKQETEARAPVADKEPKAEPDDPLAKATAKWSEADRALLKTLPPQAQDFLLRRSRETDAEFTRKTQQLAQERQQIAQFRQDYEPVMQIFAPHADQMRAKGFTPSSMIQAWYNVERQLMAGGPSAISTIKGIVSGYNIDRAQLARELGITGANPTPPEPDGAQPVQQLPPELVQRITSTEQWIAQQEHQRRMREQQEHHAAATRVMSDIEQFSSAVDKAGEPLHPHFSTVEADMARLAQLARASTGSVPPLSELYDQAVWANPSTREQLLAAERAAEQAQHAAVDQQRQKEARAKAEQSRRAGGSVQGAPGGTPQATARPRSGAGSVKDDLMAAMAEHADA